MLAGHSELFSNLDEPLRAGVADVLRMVKARMMEILVVKEVVVQVIVLSKMGGLFMFLS